MTNGTWWEEASPFSLWISSAMLSDLLIGDAARCVGRDSVAASLSVAMEAADAVATPAPREVATLAADTESPASPRVSRGVTSLSVTTALLQTIPQGVSNKKRVSTRSPFDLASTSKFELFPQQSLCLSFTSRHQFVQAGKKGVCTDL